MSATTARITAVDTHDVRWISAGHYRAPTAPGSPAAMHRSAPDTYRYRHDSFRTGEPVRHQEAIA
ncbi:hypothetical protein ACIRVF_05460 [Kitasatospora sp. NPDC101157]|uniref:hypothetical protein n=1 Tax=Kitasatospora sp. NPDC101157 TaxID=3364098 RepID=UPI0037F17FDB